jgi:hypothetical protein
MVPVAPSTQTRWRNFTPNDAAFAATAKERVMPILEQLHQCHSKKFTIDLATARNFSLPNLFGWPNASKKRLKTRKGWCTDLYPDGVLQNKHWIEKILGAV